MSFGAPSTFYYENLKMNNLSESEPRHAMEMVKYHEQEKLAWGRKLGFDNISEKAKTKEVMMGYELGDTVFANSTGEVRGADARNNKSGMPREYKTTELKEYQVDRFFEAVVDGTATMSGSMTYNAAGGTGSDFGKQTRETINSYNDIEHFHGVFFRGTPVAITQVDTDYITSDDGLMKRAIKEENGQKYKSTNGNSVSVHYENGGAREGEVVYKNDIRK